MSRRFTHYRTAALLTAALSLGIAAPAGARLVDMNAQGSFVPAQTAPAAVQTATPNGGGGGISDLGYAGIGTGAVAIVLIGGGAAWTVTRRRHHAGQPQRATGALTQH
jgi:hypothetical protein